MKILGLNIYHADASAALLVDGICLAAVEEERLRRVKHWAGFPSQAIRAVLREGGLAPEAIDAVAVSRDPRAHFCARAVANLRKDWRNLASRARNGVRLLRLQEELGAALDGVTCKPRYVEHHRAHLASAFFVSPFEEAAAVSIDGLGDYCSTMWARGRGNRLEVLGDVLFPHSLGFFYTALTQYLGFPNYGDEYKLMGLSAYGQPRYREQIRQIVQTRPDGQIRLNLDFFQHHTGGDSMTWAGGEPKIAPLYSPKLVECLGPPRVPRSELGEREMDLAASIQAVLEENYLALLRAVQKRTGEKALCLAGGVALNCVANGLIRHDTGFRDVYIQPAAPDSGTSLGAALYVEHQIHHQPRRFVMQSASCGTTASEAEIRRQLDAASLRYRACGENEVVACTAAALADGQIVGWFQGAMEFGPRALGNRSILADPRHPGMKDTLNRRIKFREPFRPFCPSVLAEAAGEWFEDDYPSPFMVMAYRIRPEKRSLIPAVVHEDGTGRLQTVTAEANPIYYRLLQRFRELTGVPILLNTSFNENEPVVERPEQAIDCFLRTQMDALAIGGFFLLKSDNATAAQERAAATAPSRMTVT